jgi:diaminohydroxyphosphoribosylaminopyrimidine deaminase / 5-amino-6-(5-phosphoribosylamino)uracil reductase
MNDFQYMEQAISLARNGKGFTSPNPCVGAVVVKNSKVVGKGWHKSAGLFHAEVNAIDDAGQKAKDATIYVTLEPCNHFGKTPPCTHKIINAGIRKVVVGCKDPNPDVCGGGIAYLKENNIEVTSGVLEKECQVLIEDFIWYIRNNKTPFVILKSASTLDGRIATATGDSKWITNEKSRGFVHRIRHEVDAILIGSGTLHLDDPSLTARIESFETRDPIRVILDSRLSIKTDATVLTQKSNAKTIVISGKDASVERKEAIEKTGATVLEVATKNQGLDLREVMLKLGKIGILSVLIEGGSKVSGSALQAGVVNKVLFFIAPKILGGDDGIPVYSGQGPELMKECLHLQDVDVSMFEEDLLVRGYLK